MEHLNNIFNAYNRTIHGAINKSSFMLFFGQPGFNNPLSRSIIVEYEASMIVPAIDVDSDMVLAEENAEKTQWSLEIASDVHEEFTETHTTITTIIADDLGNDSKIRSDINFDKEDFDMNTKTKRAPFDSFYDNSVFTVTAILMNNMIEGKNNDCGPRTVFRGVIKRI
ncbi:hypothetical protein CWI39_1058p0030 [Hamiltosporidium magnivora]|uniref:Uncharacterized protein n=1 Tax=Hamiltosporidium magnivora TaxID=148818 RepID=A0A4Q9L617_9MICR|nr:hypothetical protein CWI39_1058p0030 [Hamiltosporidium magnivora]